MSGDSSGSGWRYALVMRPAGFGSLPAGLEYSVESRPAVGCPHHELARHGILISRRELTADEVDSFELGVLFDDHGELAQSVAEDLDDYKDALAESFVSDPDLVCDLVMDSLRGIVPARYFSLADQAGLVADVVSTLGLSGQACAES
jgi:hypothetical protein